MFEAYKIGVKISLINNASLGLLALSRDFMRTEADAAKLEARIASIQKLALKGGLTLGIGAAGLSMLKGPYEEAKKLAQAQADFGTMNLSALDNAKAYAKAASMSHKILGTNITDNVKSIHDLHTAFGDLHHAISSADDFAKFSFVAKVMNNGKPVEGLVYDAAKALENRGGRVVNNDAEFRGELDLMERVYLGSRGKVNPNEFFHASQTGKMSYTLMDKDELYGPFAAYMQSKTGSTAGTANMTTMSSLVGGHMDSKAKGFLADLGLWQEGVSKKRVAMMSEISKGLTTEEKKSMGFLTPSTGGLKDEFIDLAVSSQSRFAQEVLAPAIRKKYGLDMSDESVATIIMQHFNRNTSGEMGEYIVNALKFKKDAAIFKGSMGIADAYQHYLKSPEGAEIAAAESWKNLMTVIGSVYLPTITKGLLALANGLDSLGTWMTRNKGLTTALVGAFAALAGGLAFRGTILLLTAAFRGLGGAMLMQAVGGTAGITKLGTALTGASTGLGALARAAGVFMAAYIGWKAGGWLNDNVINPAVQKLTGDKNQSLGGWVYDRTHVTDINSKKFGDFAWWRMMPGGDLAERAFNPVAGKNQQPVQVSTQINMDGRNVAEVVSQHQAKAASKPFAGASSFDYGMAAPPVGMGYAR
jgi:hypothetical protein